MIKGINNKNNENEDHVSDRIWGDLLLLQQFSLKLNYILVNKNKEKLLQVIEKEYMTQLP